MKKHTALLAITTLVLCLILCSHAFALSGPGYINNNGKEFILAGNDVTLSWNYSAFRTIRSIVGKVNGTVVFSLTSPPLTGSTTFVVPEELAGTLTIQIEYVNNSGTRIRGSSTHEVWGAGMVYEEDPDALYIIMPNEELAYLRPKCKENVIAIPETVMIDNSSHNVSRIVTGAFNRDTTINDLHITNNIRSVDPGSFTGTSNLDVFYTIVSTANDWIPEGSINLPEKTLWHCSLGRSDLDFPDDLTILGEESFSNVGVNMIIVPATISQIQNKAFSHCSDLRYIEFQNCEGVLSEDVIQGLENVTIICEKNTEVESWAVEAGYNVLYR